MLSNKLGMYKYVHSYDSKIIITDYTSQNTTIHSFIFPLNLLQDMEIVISIIVQERQQHTVYTHKICKNFILICLSNIQQ